MTILKKAIVPVLCLLTAFSFFGCSAKDQPQETQEPTTSQTEQAFTRSPARKVIIDTDTGADDASALILAAKSGNIDILGVTVLVGNVDLEQGTKNALAALEIAGCTAPVYKGSAENFSGEAINAYSVFGTDGMGDADLIHPASKAQDQDAIDFILETVNANPNEVELILLGPATNIAKAIERDPATMKKVKRIWSMGTTGYGHGNASPVAEFNVYGDPYAYKVLLDSGIPITVIGLDMCSDAGWKKEQFEQLAAENEIGKFISTSFAKYIDFYIGNGSGEHICNCDALCIMCAVYDDFITDTIKCHGSCITEKGETYGQVIFYQDGFTYDEVENDFNYNATLVRGVCASDFFPLFVRTIRQSNAA